MNIKRISIQNKMKKNKNKQKCKLPLMIINYLENMKTKAII